MSEFQQVQVLSPKGLSLIKAFSGFRSAAGLSSSGAWVVGWGHSGTVDGVPVGPGMTVTADQADTLLRSDLMSAEVAVREYITRPLKQCEFDALVSFQHSGGQLRGSLLRRLLNAAAPAEQCAREFLKAVYVVSWADAVDPVTGATVRVPGTDCPKRIQVRSVSRELQNRRTVERDCFLGRW